MCICVCKQRFPPRQIPLKIVCQQSGYFRLLSTRYVVPGSLTWGPIGNIASARVGSVDHVTHSRRLL